MSKISDLIAKLCPNGVEYLTLRDCLATISNVKWRECKGKQYRYIDLSSVNRDTHQIEETALIDEGNAPIRAQQIVKADDIILGTTRPMLKRYCRVPKEFDGQICSTGFCVLRANDDKVLSGWLLHNISSSRFFDYVEKHQKGASYPAISDAEVLNFILPVPPLEVQREVVEVLDKFALLTAELTAELEKRKKQYEHYRDTIIDRVVDDANWFVLGDIADVTKLAGFEFTKYVRYQDCGEIIALRGLNVKHGNLNLDDVKYIDGSDFKMLERSRLKTGDMLFTYVGTVGQVALVDQDNKYYLAPNVSRIRFDNSRLNPEFMKYYFQTTRFLKGEMKKYMGSSSMDNLTMGNIRKFKLPRPPLAEQERIVKILDRFDKLCNDLTSGLPAEIAARKKQYEYYRDKLLTFKKAG